MNDQSKELAALYNRRDDELMTPAEYAAALHAIDTDRFNGIPDQLNVEILDVASEVTCYGKHNRLIVFGDGPLRVAIREDIRGLPMSTEADRQTIAKHPDHKMHGKDETLEHVSSVEYASPLGRSIEHTYRVTRKGSQQ